MIKYIKLFSKVSGGKKVPTVSFLNVGMQFRRLRFDPWVGKIPWRKECLTHSSILAWEIQWTEESGELQSLG